VIEAAEELSAEPKIDALLAQPSVAADSNIELVDVGCDAVRS
jgi:hypothetical protein